MTPGMLLDTNPLHDVWDLRKSLLRHLLVHGKQSSLINVGLRCVGANS